MRSLLAIRYVKNVESGFVIFSWEGVGRVQRQGEAPIQLGPFILSYEEPYTIQALQLLSWSIYDLPHTTIERAISISNFQGSLNM